jgi:hypothetical protein
MRNLIKITTIWSLLIITCLLNGCGSDGDGEQLIRNQGDIDITVTDSSGARLSGVLVQVRKTAGTGEFVNVGTTDISGKLTFTGDAGDDYFFTFSKEGFTTQTDIRRTPQLTSTVELNVIMIASI